MFALSGDPNLWIRVTRRPPRRPRSAPLHHRHTSVIGGRWRKILTYPAPATIISDPTAAPSRWRTSRRPAWYAAAPIGVGAPVGSGNRLPPIEEDANPRRLERIQRARTTGRGPSLSRGTDEVAHMRAWGDAEPSSNGRVSEGGSDLRFFSTIAAFATPRDEIALTQSGWVRASAALIAGWTALSMAASLRVLEIATAGSPESALKQELVDIPVSHALAVRVAHGGSLPRGIARHGEAHRTV